MYPQVLLIKFQVFSRDTENQSLALLDELESSKEQIKTLKDALNSNEEEKNEMQKHYEHHLELINELKLEIEDWKSKAVFFYIYITLYYFKVLRVLGSFLARNK